LYKHTYTYVWMHNYMVVLVAYSVLYKCSKFCLNISITLAAKGILMDDLADALTDALEVVCWDVRYGHIRWQSTPSSTLGQW
jgi:hypothetical protein